jgi:hypothetical protein
VWGRPGETILSHGRLRDAGEYGEPDQQIADVELLDPNGVVLARLTGVRLQEVRSELVLGLRKEGEGRRELDDPALASPAVDLAELKSLAPAEQRDRVEAFLAEQAAAVLRLGPADNVNPQKSLVEMGMDSMMGVEFLYRINRGLKINLPGQTLLADPYLSPLAEEIVTLLGEENSPAAASDRIASAVPAPAPDSSASTAQKTRRPRSPIGRTMSPPRSRSAP